MLPVLPRIGRILGLLPFPPPAPAQSAEGAQPAEGGSGKEEGRRFGDSSVKEADFGQARIMPNMTMVAGGLKLDVPSCVRSTEQQVFACVVIQARPLGKYQNFWVAEASVDSCCGECHLDILYP